MDSLALSRIVLTIEAALGRPLPIEQFALQPTLRQLAFLLYDDKQDAISMPPPQTDIYPIGSQGARPVGLNRLRWLRNSLLQRGPMLRGRALPYKLGTRLLRAVISHPRIRQILYPREVKLLKKCLEAIPIKVETETVIQQSLMINSWPRWRQLVLENDGAFDRWVTVKGEDILHRLAAENRGVVLAFPHTELKKLLHRLPVLQDRELTTIGNVGAATLAAHGLSRLAEAVVEGAVLSKTAVRSAQFIHALRVLQMGGTVVVATDDDDGTGGIRVCFHGRWRFFRPGAAELALRANAAFVPLFASMDLGGDITFEFLEPLPSEGDSYPQQVRSLLRQYAFALSERYTSQLGSMEWYILRKFLRYPKAS